MAKDIEFSERGDPIKNWSASLDDVAEGKFKVTTQLEEVLAAAFEDTQQRVHILSGSLKASGKSESDFQDDEWTGTITYGGVLWATPAPGPPNDPVDYAIYEMARGGAHNFFGGLPPFEDHFGEILRGNAPG